MSLMNNKKIIKTCDDVPGVNKHCVQAQRVLVSYETHKFQM